jgi:hypothetical protein
MIDQFSFIHVKIKDVCESQCTSLRRCKLQEVMPRKTGHRTAKSNRVLLKLGISIELNLKFDSTKFFIQPTNQFKSVPI